MDKDQLKRTLEAVLMASSQPLNEAALLKLFDETQQPEKDDLTAALQELMEECEGRSFELKKVSSGYRFQVRKEYADHVTRLWEEKPARYSRALLETLALIAYKQPITRGEIEAVRGVSVSSHIIKTLDERGWIKIVGHRDVPGKPSLYATTKEFLDYFNLESLNDLPSLQEIRDIDAINAELDLRMPHDESQAEGVEQDENDAEGVIGLEVAADDAEAQSGEAQSVDDEAVVEAVASQDDEPEQSDEPQLSVEEDDSTPPYKAASVES